MADLSLQYRGTKMDAQLADYIIGESGCETSHSPHVAITEHVTLGWYSWILGRALYHKETKLLCHEINVNITVDQILTKLRGECINALRDQKKAYLLVSSSKTLVRYGG